MATDHLRVYSVVFANFAAGSVTEDQWLALADAAKVQPLSAAILDAARGRGAQCYITARKRSQNAAALLLYTLVGFEVDREDVDALLVVLNTQAALFGIPGAARVKFAGVFQAELRAAAADLGYPVTAQNKLSVTLVNGDIENTFQRDVAIAQAQAYLAANTAIWYS